jgi:predicted nucleic acid-binding protein
MIIDANVAFKWLIEEDLSDNAARLLPRADLLAPTILDIEVLQALTRRFRQRLLDRERLQVAVDGLREAPLERIDWRRVGAAALKLSLDLRATYIDCLYLALAVDLDDIMVIADERFARAVESNSGLCSRVRSLSAF